MIPQASTSASKSTLSISDLTAIQVAGQTKIGDRLFPQVLAPSSTSTSSSNKRTGFMYLQELFQNNRKQILEQVTKHGAIYFKGFNVQSVNEMASVLNKLGLSSFEYIGGAAVRKLMVGRQTQPQKQQKNQLIQIFTTNQSPPSQPIPFHNELMQNSNYPSYLAFYCYSQAEEGGSTMLANGQQIYNYIKQNYGEFLQKLESLQLRYIRVVGKQDNPKSAIGRGWKNIFKCQTKQQAQIVMKQRGYQWQWIDNEDQDCRLISKPIPGVRVAGSGKKVFCNQFGAFKDWIDDKNQPSKALRFGDFSQIPTEILQNIYQYCYKIKAAIPWSKGDFFLIDNQVAMHAREPFKGPNRRVYASLLKNPKSNIKQGLHLTLNSGDEMPIVGFGTWKLPNQICQDTVYQAIKCGYRLIDGAAVYGNEVEVGRAIKRAIAENIVTRKDLFITSKLWCTFHRPQNVRPAFMRTLTDLKLQYLDLYLIHFPTPIKYIDPKIAYPTVFQDFPLPTSGPTVIADKVPIIDTWRELQKLYNEGLIRNIGVSNFNVSLLRDLINQSKIKPAVNQVQIHPYLTQKKFIRYCQQNGVQITSYSTFGGASYQQLNRATKQQLIVETETLKELSQKYSKTGPQILLRWAIQQGLVVIPKTSKVQRLKQNMDVFGWSIEQQDMKSIDKLNINRRYNDPGVFFGEENYIDLLTWD